MVRKRQTPLERFAETGTTDRKAAFLKRREDAGLVRVELWVPKGRVGQLKELVAVWVDGQLQK